MVRSIWLLATAAIGTATGLLVAALLYRLLYQGQAQSFDAMLYARSLWGIAHGDFYNPISDHTAFAIHGHFMLLSLAPLAWVVPAPMLLWLAQIVSLAATVVLVVCALKRHRNSAAPIFALVAFVGTPALLNPFLFDVRPDLWGVPFVLAALLRMAAHKRVDRGSLLLLVVATLTREEWGLVAASAVLFGPVADRAESRKVRWAAAASFAGWCVLYYVVVRPALGGSDASIVAHLRGTTATGGAALLDYARIAGLVLGSCGGLALLGWRSLGAAVPGVALLFATQWHPEYLASTHFAMFAAPGLIAAGLAGLDRVVAAPRRSISLLAAVMIAALSFATLGALPGAGRFAAAHFDMRAPDGSVRWDPRAHTQVVVDAHALAATVPLSEGLAISHSFGFPVSGRSRIWTTRTLRRLLDLDRGAPLPDGLDAVLLVPSEWESIGRPLVDRHAFHPVTRRGNALLLRPRHKAIRPRVGCAFWGTSQSPARSGIARPPGR